MEQVNGGTLCLGGLVGGVVGTVGGLLNSGCNDSCGGIDVKVKISIGLCL